MVCFELHNKKANHKTKRLCRNYQKRVLSILVMTKTEDPRFWYFPGLFRVTSFHARGPSSISLRMAATSGFSLAVKRARIW